MQLYHYAYMKDVDHILDYGFYADSWVNGRMAALCHMTPEGRGLGDILLELDVPVEDIWVIEKGMRLPAMFYHGDDVDVYFSGFTPYVEVSDIQPVLERNLFFMSDTLHDRVRIQATDFERLQAAKTFLRKLPSLDRWFEKYEKKLGL